MFSQNSRQFETLYPCRTPKLSDLSAFTTYLTPTTKVPHLHIDLVTMCGGPVQMITPTTTPEEVRMRLITNRAGLPVQEEHQPDHGHHGGTPAVAVQAVVL